MRMSPRLGTAGSARISRLGRGLVVALGLAVGLALGGPVRDAQAKDRLPPEYGTMRDRATHLTDAGFIRFLLIPEHTSAVVDSQGCFCFHWGFGGVASAALPPAL